MKSPDKEIVAYGLRKRNKKEMSQGKKSTPEKGEDNWLARLSKEELREHQETDPDLRNIIEWKRSLTERRSGKTSQRKVKPKESLAN